MISSCRYGKIGDKHLLRMRELFATQEDIETDDKFLTSRMIQGYHYSSGNDANRKSVESDNIRTMFALTKRLGNKPIVHWKSIHMPANKMSSLEKISGKEFCGLLKAFVSQVRLPGQTLRMVMGRDGRGEGPLQLICWARPNGSKFLKTYRYQKISKNMTKKWVTFFLVFWSEKYENGQKLNKITQKMAFSEK